LWDIGHQRCIATYDIHGDSVWALVASDDFSTVYSGGMHIYICAHMYTFFPLNELISFSFFVIFISQLLAGRDGCVFKTDLTVPTGGDAYHSTLLFKGEAPVLKVILIYYLYHPVKIILRDCNPMQMAVSPDASNVWVATTDSTIHNWVPK
jgi:hypothetical protein